jgi:hypothetical protein
VYTDETILLEFVFRNVIGTVRLADMKLYFGWDGPRDTRSGYLHTSVVVSNVDNPALP